MTPWQEFKQEFKASVATWLVYRAYAIAPEVVTALAAALVVLAGGGSVEDAEAAHRRFEEALCERD